MVTAVQRVRDQWAAHLNGLEPGQARSWVLGHRLLVLGDHHGLAPELRSHMTQLSRRVLAQNLLRIQLYKTVVQVLGPIPSVPLKGIALIDSLFENNVGLRPMGDIDLLIPESAMDEAITRLEQAPDIGLKETPVSHRLRHVLYHRTLVGDRGPVELHTFLGKAYMPGSGWEAVRPEEATVHGVKTHRLPPSVELVHLLVHFYKHRPFSCLGWVDEILQLCDRATAQTVQALPRVADRLRCRTTFGMALGQLRLATRLPVLPSVDLERLIPNPIRSALHRTLFKPAPSMLRPPERRGIWLEELHAPLLADRLSDAAADLARQALGHLLARFPSRIPPGSR